MGGPDGTIWLDSLRSKRFRGVGEQRKTEERGFRCFASTKKCGESQNKKEGGGGGEGMHQPSPAPSFSPSIFPGNSLLLCPTKTLARQAIGSPSGRTVYLLTFVEYLHRLSCFKIYHITGFALTVEFFSLFSPNKLTFLLVTLSLESTSPKGRL